MHSHSAAVIGASGYSGLELTRLLARHPHARLTAIYSDRWSGERAGARLPLPGPAASLAYLPLAEGEAADADVVFLATPAEVSADLVPRLLARGAKLVVDLSGAFRLTDPAAYPAWYGFTHPAPELLAEARYGCPELGREALAGARLVTNPGCYATTIALALAPLVRSGVASPDGIAVTGLSGVSGAGRKSSEDYSFVEVSDDLRAYRLGRHQHVPEIEQTVARHAGACGPISFSPVLVPIRRGILATAVLRPAPGATQADVAAALERAYGDEPFVSVRAPDKVAVKDVVHTNRCHVGAALDARAGALVAVSAIDNLVKGAAGQAVQSMNAALGWPETAGLDLLGG
ncbi:N-acetyl-gamma-glutamyl-phosphate reductase [Anaeromyxobacter dehalogenans 2CP-1]|uniref:N-acetyl-gamma-glutamyl-phosphate reductase n=1 Tax=Anaeromyxobacter dehalogenans (strain ATCC BAA-258 / DSM 21875 / 2CP-1) TaxID=455488 RepID=B8JC50_ANAD2|nr:N-acetyl-gamma-glutamyl-phosphate reductase [Anaeromyxobacter dehalogenans]ACL63972.1 N-acetyl-gamma-glutamyl-phosphate reductase [Anaeromyxobacter dehalogenans 2CP-1]